MQGNFIFIGNLMEAGPSIIVATIAAPTTSEQVNDSNHDGAYLVYSTYENGDTAFMESEADPWAKELAQKRIPFKSNGLK